MRNTSPFLLAFLIMLLPAARAEETSITMARGRANVSYTLRTGIAEGKMVYIGKGGAIDRQVNAALRVHEGDIVQVTLINGEGAEHDIVFPDMHASSHR